MTHSFRCADSGRVLLSRVLPVRRVRCFLCNRLVRLVSDGFRVQVPTHFVPLNSEAAKRAS